MQSPESTHQIMIEHYIFIKHQLIADTFEYSH